MIAAKAAWHFVSPVAASVPPTRKRLTCSGWWMSDDVGKATAMEKNHDDSSEARNFIRHIDGGTGKVLQSRRSIQPDQ